MLIVPSKTVACIAPLVNASMNNPKNKEKDSTKFNLGITEIRSLKFLDKILIEKNKSVITNDKIVNFFKENIFPIDFIDLSSLIFIKRKWGCPHFKTLV